MKCAIPHCMMESEEGLLYCAKCFDELGEMIEQNPIGGISDNPLKIIISSNEAGHGSTIDIEGAKFGYVPIGDIVAENKDCVIERKEVNDFLGSCANPHMWLQAKNMQDNYKRQVVIIVGYLDKDYVDYKHLKLISHGYKSIAALIRMGITVLIVKNDAMLSTLSEAILKEAEPKDPTILIKRVEKNGKFSVIEAIEGVGQAKAKALIEKYVTVCNLAVVPIQELSEFKVNNRKIGEKVAKRILETLN